jgi:hypothetical protein
LIKAEKIINLFSQLPQRLYEDTLGAWLKSSGSDSGGSTTASTLAGILSDRDRLLAECPALLFRVDRCVFKSPVHFRCFTRLLGHYLECARNANVIRLTKAAVYCTKQCVLHCFIYSINPACLNIYYLLVIIT